MKIASISAIAGLLATIALPVLALEPKPSCQALEAWVSQLEKLPTDYASVTALPLDQRRAVFARLADAERSALWQHQLQSAATAEGLNAGQRELIAEAMRLVTPENYAVSRARGGADFEAARKIRKSLEQRVAKAFSRPEMREIFYQLGPLPAGLESGAISQICDCSSGYDCKLGQRCDAPLCEQRIGCGPFGQEYCGGMCGAF